MAQVVLSKTAQKFFIKLKSSDKKKVVKGIDKLEVNPHLGEKLKGQYEGLMKLKVWPYRIIYRFTKSKNLVEIVTIGHRQGVYK
ncbi:MAG: type II toxin-antitoxin system RelE/ParE family toxin [Candidatus Curtissbacteria bacterium]